MKKKFFNILLIFVLVFSVNASEDIDLSETVDLFSSSIPEEPKAIEPETVVIKVNGKDITFGEIQAEMSAQLQRLAGQISQEQVPMIQEQLFLTVKERMINNILLNEAIIKEGIIIDEKIIDQEVSNIENNLPDHYN